MTAGSGDGAKVPVGMPALTRIVEQTYGRMAREMLERPMPFFYAITPGRAAELRAQHEAERAALIARIRAMTDAELGEWLDRLHDNCDY